MTLTDYFINNVQLQKEWLYDRNTVSTDELTPYTRTKVWWRCEKGHEWQATLDSRVNLGRSCPYCANQIVIPGENDIVSVASHMVKLWHPTRNGNLQPSAVMPGSNKMIWWQCEKGHEWQARAYAIKSGSGCPYCAGKRAIPGETDLATVYPNIMEMWSLRNELSPTEVTAASHKKAWWICEKGHEWEAKIDTVTVMGCGCPYCAGKRAIPGETDLATLRPDLMEQWDFEKNAIDPRETTVASHDKVWWKCELGHSWKAAVFSRTRENGSGCPYCTGRLVLPGFNDLATLKPKLAEQWYQPLNGELKPEDVTLGSNKKVWWQCSDGHVWQAFIYARAKKNGTGCPVCAGMVKRRRSSAVEHPQQKRYAYPRKVAEKTAAGMHI